MIPVGVWKLAVSMLMVAFSPLQWLSVAFVSLQPVDSKMVQTTHCVYGNIMLSRKPQQKEFVTVGLPFVITECHRRILKHTCKCWAFESAVYIIALSSASTKNNKKRIFFFFFMVRIYIPPSMLPKLQPPLCRRWSWCWFRPSAVHTHPKYSRGCAGMKLLRVLIMSGDAGTRHMRSSPWGEPSQVPKCGNPGQEFWLCRRSRGVGLCGNQK